MEINIEKLMQSRIELEREIGCIKRVVSELESLDMELMRQEIFENIHIKIKREIEDLYYQCNCLNKYMDGIDKIIYIYQKNEQRLIDCCYREKAEFRFLPYVVCDLTYMDEFVRNFNIM